MSDFRPYDHETAGHELKVKDDGVYVAIRGSVSWKEGKYTNSANETIEVKLPDDEVEDFMREYAGYVDECIENHAEWYDKGLDQCPVCGVGFNTEELER